MQVTLVKHQQTFTQCINTYSQHVMLQKLLQVLQVRFKTLKLFFVLHSTDCKSMHLSHTIPFVQGLKRAIKPAANLT